jgi:anaerobic magnesium-protoporphyrin IX monomethyl ester cyclase
MRIALIGAELEENLAVRYIWSSLEKAGHEVVQVVFNREEELEQAARDLAQSGAALAGFSMVFTRRAGEFARLAARARQLGFSGHLCAGGHFAALNTENLLRDEPAFDSVVCGEGEQIMVDLASCLPDLSSVRGLVWRQPGGAICRNEPALKPPDLDVLPPPVRKYPFDRFLGMPIVNMLSSRGCTHYCAFCSIAAWHRVCGGDRLRQRSVAQVAYEIGELYAQGVRLFNFHDDDFFSSTKEESFARFHMLKRELHRRRVGRIGFAVKARPDDIDTEILHYLKRMGLFRVFLGIEAGTSDALSRLGRGQTLAENDRALNLVNALNIHACFNLLLLNPDSTLEDAAANVRFLRTHPRNPMNFCRTEIYSGTPLEEKLRREGRLLGDYWGYNYVISDHRAQLVFELIYSAFSGRNFGENCIHHTTMAVDYECQILEHFVGCSRLLKQRVKQFIVDVNLNTCEYLAEAIHAAHSGFATAHQRHAFLNELHRRVSADNDRFQQKGGGLLRMLQNRLEEIRERSFSSRIRLTAARAAILASVVITSGQAQVYHTEPAPPPPINQPSALHQELKEKVLPLLVKRLDSPADVEIRVDSVNNRNSIWLCTFVVSAYCCQVFTIDEAKGILLKHPLPEFRISAQFSKEDVTTALKTKGTVPPGPQVIAKSGDLLAVKDIVSNLHFQPQDMKIVLWFEQTGSLAGADLYGVSASSEEKFRLLNALFVRFREANKYWAGKIVVFSYKADEFIREHFLTEMAPLPLPENRK